MGEQENNDAQDGAPRTGLVLQEARQERGLTHEDVERDTKIRVRYLEAMERDDYDALPGAVYAQGFLKTYANYLQLDGEKLSQGLKDSGGGYEERLGDRSTTGGPEESRSGVGSVRPRRPRRRRVPVMVVVGGTLTLVVLTILVLTLYFVGLQASRSTNDAADSSARVEESPSPGNDGAQQGNEDPRPEQEPANEAAPEEPAPQETDQQNPDAPASNADEAPAPPPPEPAPEEPPPPEILTMQVRVQGNISWLNIETDGETVFTQVAESGFVQTFEANESITVWSGNAGAVYISVNGQDYGQLGESGQTVIREFNLKTAEN